MIIGMLDVQAGERMAQLLFKGNLLVRSHPQLGDLKRFTPDALAALAVGGIITLHPIRQLHATLRSDRCATCPAFGSLLFLLTAERCCLECLCLSPAYGTVSVEDAKKTLGLSDLHLQQLPVLRVPHRPYWPEYYHPTQAERRCLVSAVAAGNLVGLPPTEPEEDEDEQLRSDLGETSPVNIHYGMVSIRFPAVFRDSLVEAGFWCRLCLLTYEVYALELEFRHLLKELANKHSSTGQVKRPGAALTLQARPSALSAEHLQSCHSTSLHSLGTPLVDTRAGILNNITGFIQ
jgi:hypothetical protein